MNTRKRDIILYHYCTMDTFMGVVRNKQLWMSDISRSNDYNELKILFPFIYNKIEEEYTKAEFDFIYKRRSGVTGIKRLLQDVDELLFSFEKNGNLTSFVVCFSEVGDLLSQWRGYANDGKGFALGLSYDELKKYCTRNHKMIEIRKIKYINRAQMEDILERKARSLLKKIGGLRKQVHKLLPHAQLVWCSLNN